MCIACVPGQPTEFYEEREPYVWAIDGSQQQKQDHVFEFVSKQLIGKPAVARRRRVGRRPSARSGSLYIETSAGVDRAGRPLRRR